VLPTGDSFLLKPGKIEGKLSIIARQKATQILCGQAQKTEYQGTFSNAVFNPS
jgi:hypothetical protein